MSQNAASCRWVSTFTSLVLFLLSLKATALTSDNVPSLALSTGGVSDSGNDDTIAGARPCAQNVLQNHGEISQDRLGLVSSRFESNVRQDEEPPFLPLTHVKIPVVFHILQSDNGMDGHVPYEALQEQIQHANEAYAGLQNVQTGANASLTLILQAVHYWNSSRMFSQCETLDFETNDIRDLQINPRQLINVFTCRMSKYSGWAWPCYCDERVLQFAGKGGFFMDYRYIPPMERVWDPIPIGGRLQRVGDTFVHELGHALGLLHPADGGCSYPNDYIDDTPAQGQFHGTWDECPSDLDTCPSFPGNDPVTNFMDYSDDQCRDSFTRGQTHRMHQYIDTYLPSIRTMEYHWGCVGEQFDATSPTKKSFALCHSPCYKRRTPNGKASPATGWCHVHGGNLKKPHDSKPWGKCVCPGSPNYALIPGAPQLYRSTCMNPKACMMIYWSLAETCHSARTFKEALETCGRMGYRLCTPAQLKSVAFRSMLANSPCENQLKQIWARGGCTKGRKQFVDVSTLKATCRKGGMAGLACCY